jgi:hypothetical protein
MARYQLTGPAFIDGAYREAGAEIEFEGIPGPHMHPLDKAAERALAEAREPRDSSETVFTGFYGHPGVREPPPPTDPPINIDTPYVEGIGAVDEILTCTMGNWEGEPTSYVYEWKRDGEEDVGIDDPAYVVVAADAGSEITCIVTATNAAGSTEAPPSNAVVVEAARRGGKEKDK